jgi:hypothetical protein
LPISYQVFELILSIKTSLFNVFTSFSQWMLVLTEVVKLIFIQPWANLLLGLPGNDNMTEKTVILPLPGGPPIYSHIVIARRAPY